MKSRIVALSLSLLLFFASLHLIGFAEDKVDADATAQTETSVTAETTETTTKETVTEPKTETIVCSFKDISYGSSEDNKLDLHLPVDDREETGLVLFLHGGGWIAGDKAAVKKNFGVLKENKNYATASINYRLAETGKTDIYDIINDITAAISHIKTLAAGYSVNITKVILCGHSAGGHLALLYAYRYKDISPVTPVGVFVTSPAVELSLDEFYKSNSLGDEKHMCELMSKACGETFTPQTRAGYEKLLKELSPTEYVTEDSVPTLIAHGKKDTVAPYKGSEILSERLTAFSVNHDLITFENSGHTLDKDKETRDYTETLLQERINSWLGIETN